MVGARLLCEVSELLRRRHAKRWDEQTADDAEECGVYADAERKSDDGGGGEARSAPKCADGIHHVAPAIVEPAERSRALLRVLHSLDTAERDSCRPSRLR